MRSSVYSLSLRERVVEHCDVEHSVEDIVNICNVPYVANVVRMISEDYLS